MANSGIIPAGTWVDVERTLLSPGERAPGVPADTAATPYVMRVSGFLQEDAELGAECRVRTLIGHEHAGVVREVNPSHTHSFGPVVPELLTIGLEVVSTCAPMTVYESTQPPREEPR